MRRPLAALAVTGALLVGLSGCGSDEPEISPAAAKVLAADVDAITAAARAKDAAQVQAALKTLRAHVDEQQESGELSADRASRILAAGAKVALDVGVPPPKVVVSRVPAPPAPGPERGKDAKKDDEDEKKDDKNDEDKKDDEEGEDKDDD